MGGVGFTQEWDIFVVLVIFYLFFFLSLLLTIILCLKAKILYLKNLTSNMSDFLVYPRHFTNLSTV